MSGRTIIISTEVHCCKWQEQVSNSGLSEAVVDTVVLCLDPFPRVNAPSSNCWECWLLVAHWKLSLAVGTASPLHALRLRGSLRLGRGLVPTWEYKSPALFPHLGCFWGAIPDPGLSVGSAEIPVAIHCGSACVSAQLQGWFQRGLPSKAWLLTWESVCRKCNVRQRPQSLIFCCLVW